MPIDWKSFEDDLDLAIDNAGKRTDAQLASRISSVTRFTDDEVKKMFPKPADVDKLKELMLIVKSAESKNRRSAKLVKNIDGLAKTVMTLLEKVV